MKLHFCLRCRNCGRRLTVGRRGMYMEAERARNPCPDCKGNLSVCGKWRG